MINSRNKLRFNVAKRLFAVCTLGAAISLMIACGSNETSTTTAVNTKSSVENANLTNPSPTASPLLASLAALYPNGQVPTDQSEVAAVARLATTKSNTTIAQSGVVPFSENSALSLAASSAFGIVSTHANPTSFAPQALSDDAFRPISRVQNTSLYGAYFFTIYPSERSSALTGNPNWSYEGPAFSASLVSDVDLFPVYRFRNLQNGSYLYSIYEAERSNIATNFQSTFIYEGVSWYARQTPAIGWKPLYRFRNVTNGTYLFSAYEDEKNAIIATYSAIFQLEGIAYYVKEPDPVDKYIGSWTSCSASGQTAPAYVTTNLSYSKVSAASLYLVGQAIAGYSDSTCKTQTHVNNGTALTGTVTYAGTKLASLKTVDKMYTVLSNGSILGDIYYAQGNKLFTGGGSTDTQGYFNLLSTTPYYLN